MKREPTRTVTLTDCDREPIHVPGSIQAHGSLIALNDHEQVVAWSMDLEDRVRGVEGAVPTLEHVVGAEDASRLRPLIAAREIRPILPVPLSASGTQGLVHRNAQDLDVVEFEALDLTYEQLAGVLRRTQETTQRLGRIESTEGLCDALATAVRDLTGFDRVMVYRFAEDWHGWVVAEDRDADVESFLGFHFPASDIPAQARALYERNPLRLIVDVDAAPVALRARPDGPDPLALDLSDSVLRSVSPIHIQYLKNMNVGASMSISLLRGGRLWGMVACHHRHARNVPFEVRQACELLSQFVSSQIELHDELESSRRSARVRELLMHLAENLVPDTEFGDSLTAHAAELRALVACDAVMVSAEGRTVVDGATAEPDDAATWLAALPVPEEEPWSSTDLDDHAPCPVEPGMKGALVVRTTGAVPATVAWLRKARSRSVRWAGDPNKPVVRDADGMERLHPRESFALWIQESAAESAPWTETEIETARELQTLILSPSIRTAFAIQAQARELESLNRALSSSNEELERFAYIASHDLRAPLRAVENIVQWLNEDERDRLSEQAHEYLDLLTSRVHRMDRMMVDLLAYSRAGREDVEIESIDLEELVADMTEVLSSSVGIRIEFEGVPVVRAARVPVRQILMNLVSNAIKHHDRPRGRVVVRASSDADALVLAVEDDGPGIPTEHRERVFEMFTTLSSRDVTEGSGIGLALVRRYARSLGGDATVEPGELRGTRVIVRLPFENSHE